MEKETYRQKLRIYQSFLSMFPNVKIHTVTPKQITVYLATCKTNDAYNRHRKELSALFEYAKDILGLVTVNPVAVISRLPHTPKKKYIPNEKEILSLVMACDPKTDEKELLICIMLTVARVDEILRLKWEDVNFEKRILSKYTKKTSDKSYVPITVPMNEDLYAVLWKMWEKRTQETYVFFNERNQDRYYSRPKFMKSLCKRAGINPHFGFHTLRHYMASLMSDKMKVSTKTIQQFLGHQSMKTTEIYLHSLEASMTDAADGLTGLFGLESNECSGEVCGEVLRKKDGSTGGNIE
ncbi:MAG: site-specific integrase [Desulfamplus sp.]|nr:site-specific integrase [Desulfamplus sp.]